LGPNLTQTWSKPGPNLVKPGQTAARQTRSDPVWPGRESRAKPGLTRSGPAGDREEPIGF
jgi:hypothetical protein